jgi:indole-3-glycerol phosphate synthase
VSNSASLPPATGTALDRIVSAKRSRLAEAKRTVPFTLIREMAESAWPALPFERALRSKPGVAVIAEMKRASVSAGDLAQSMSPAEQARMYCQAGAAALSVLTELDFFSGTIADLGEARKVAAPLDVPVLQKDFVFDEYQVYEARASGADAVLLIIALLPPDRYRTLIEMTRSLGMAALVEVFDERELDDALAEKPQIVGVNNRNLKTLETTLSVFESVGPRIPSDVLAVAESGLKSLDDVRRMAAAGAKAILVGEWLMRAGDRAGELIKAMLRIEMQD